MTEQCPSCGGFCKKGCERENVQPEQRSEQWWKHEVSNAFAQGYEKGRLQREWQGLTEDDALQLLPVMPYEYEVDVEMILEFASAIEAKLKEKNGTS